MSQQTKPTLLAIGVADLQSRTPLFDLYTASTLRQAIATIRLIYFDLLVVGLDDPKLDVWELIGRVATAWPHQRWILASGHITTKDELRARSLGALLVLDSVPDETWLADFAVSLRRRDAAKSDRNLAVHLLAPVAKSRLTPVEIS